MIKYPSDNQEAHKPMGLWACEPVNLTKTPTYPKIPDPPIVAAGLLGPDLVDINSAQITAHPVRIKRSKCTLHAGLVYCIFVLVF